MKSKIRLFILILVMMANVLTSGCQPVPPKLYKISSSPYGDQFGEILGGTQGVLPWTHYIVVYIYVNGGWTKPTFAEPIILVDFLGLWYCDITTGGVDELATKVAVFLLPFSYPEPPLLSGSQEIPQELYDNAVDHLMIDRKNPEE